MAAPALSAMSRLVPLRRPRRGPRAPARRPVRTWAVPRCRDDVPRGQSHRRADVRASSLLLQLLVRRGTKRVLPGPPAPEDNGIRARRRYGQLGVRSHEPSCRVPPRVRHPRPQVATHASARSHPSRAPYWRPLPCRDRLRDSLRARRRHAQAISCVRSRRPGPCDPCHWGQGGRTAALPHLSCDGQGDRCDPHPCYSDRPCDGHRLPNEHFGQMGVANAVHAARRHAREGVGRSRRSEHVSLRSLQQRRPAS